MFRSYASLGFDDHRWLPVDDLTAIVAFGERDLQKVKLEIQGREARILSLNSTGASGHDADVANFKKEIEKFREKVQKLEAKLSPYRAACALQDLAKSRIEGF